MENLDDFKKNSAEKRLEIGIENNIRVGLEFMQYD
jgi:hypothetical protein